MTGTREPFATRPGASLAALCVRKNFVKAMSLNIPPLGEGEYQIGVPGQPAPSPQQIYCPSGQRYAVNSLGLHPVSGYSPDC